MLPTIGQQEMELILFLSDNHEPMTTREITERFGEPHSLARTTVLTMLERLRKKNLVTRSDIQGIHHYSSRLSKEELLQGMIRNFIQQTLGGSVSPFVTYLTQEGNLNKAELAEFKRLIEDLDNGRKDD
ncbi:MAG: BlaI/MecI/CopY family transcriptional regulator [Bacillota bacterium]|nr:BlaI/MecI/CopY family transcriptional regulator [Bacillota bacterium]